MSAQRSGRPAQALGIIAAWLLLALLAAFAARLGWELGGKMLRLSDADIKMLGVEPVAGVEFESDMLDQLAARYRVVEVRQHNGRRVVCVERLHWLPPRRRA